MNKLWLLRPIEDLPKGNPWDPWFDRAFGFVVRAETEKDARFIAGKDSGDEMHSSWHDASLSTCVELSAEGEPCVIIRDFAAA